MNPKKRTPPKKVSSTKKETNTESKVSAKKKTEIQKIDTPKARAEKENPKNPKSPVKKAPTKIPTSLPKIYNDPKFNQHPETTGINLIKVLIRSPLEAYVFWKYSPETIHELVEGLFAPSASELQFRLRLTYKNQAGLEEETWYDLAPFTESYYCKFMFPVTEIEASIYGKFNDNQKQVLHSTGGDLPPGVESFRLDVNWIHPEWIERGFVSQNSAGEYFFNSDSPFEFFGSYKEKIAGESSFSLVKKI